MFKRTLLLLVAVCAAVVSLADEVRLNPNAPERYVVQKGDTLWDISGKFLTDPWRWPDIWAINQQIENPHLIFPGDELALVWIGDERRITTVRRGEAGNTLKLRPGEAGENGDVRLSPAVRVEPISNAIPALQRRHIQAFLNGNRIIDENVLANAGYILAGPEGRLILGSGDRAYARGFWDKDVTSYEIFRPGDAIEDFETGEFLGFEAIGLGEAKLLRVQNDVGTFDIERTYQDIAPGDRMMVLPPERLEPVFFPSAPANALEGRVVHITNGSDFAGQYDVIVIDRGEREGLIPGNVLHLWQRGAQVTDPVTGDTIRLPGENVGTGMVFRTFERLSYVLVLESLNPIQVGDAITDPR